MQLRRLAPLLAAPLLVLVPLFGTALIYWPGLRGPFLLDDYANTTLIRLHTLDWRSLVSVAFSNDSGALRRPLANASFALNDYFTGLDPFAYKYVNLTIHLLTGALLMWLAIRLVREYLGEDQKMRTWLVAAVTASLWLLHPLQVSTVLYVVQRMAQLSTLFTVAALLCYVIGRQLLQKHRIGGTFLMAGGTGLCTVLGLMSKENAVLLPLFIWCIHYFVFRAAARSRGAKNTSPLLAWYHWLFVYLPLLLGGIYLLTHWHSYINYASRDFTLAQRLLTESHVLLFYLRLLLIPNLRDFGLYHDDIPLTTHFDPSTAISIGLLVCLGIFILAARNRAPVAAFGLAWFFAGHTLESTIFPLEIAFEHRNYLPSFGIFLPLSYYAFRPLPGQSRLMAFRLPALVLFLSALIAITYLRVQNWSSTNRFVIETVRNHPQSFRAHVSFAGLLSIHGYKDAALKQLDRAERLRPNDPSVPLMKIWVQCSARRIAPSYFTAAEKAIQTGTHPGYLFSTMLLLQQSMFTRTCPAVPPRSLLGLTTALVQNASLMARSNRVLAYVFHARALAATGHYRKSIFFFEKAFSFNRSNLDPLFEIATMQIDLGKITAAAQTTQRIRRLAAHRLEDYHDRMLNLEKELRNAERTRTKN